jgi:hypothetical protein
MRGHAGGAIGRDAWQRQRIRNAGRELPSAESLGVPEEALLSGVPMSWVLMFWQTWRGRNMAPEDILKRFREVTGRGATAGNGRRRR